MIHLQVQSNQALTRLSRISKAGGITMREATIMNKELHDLRTTNEKKKKKRRIYTKRIQKIFTRNTSY